MNVPSPETSDLENVPPTLQAAVLNAIRRHCDDRNIAADSVSIEDRSIGINCKVFLITIGAETPHPSRFVFKCFGEIFRMQKPVAQEVQRDILEYQDQLNQHGVLFPFTQHKGDFQLYETPEGWAIINEEQFFGDGSNHLDLLRKKEANDHESVLLYDIETIIGLQSSATASVLGEHRTLLKTGFDAKPDNFVTHGQTSVYIDLYPPLPMEKGELKMHPALLHPTHPIDKEAWFFFVSTLEGSILRYLNSGEFKLGQQKENIRRHYGAVLDYIEPLIPRKAFSTISSQVREQEFSLVNAIYKTP